MEGIMVKVCSCCSNINVDYLKENLEGIEVKVGCVDNCAESSGKSFGLINGELVLADDEAAFVKEVLSRK